MKHVVTGLTLALACAGAAYAQSNVTLYGSMDAGVAYVSNQGGNSKWIAEQGGTQPDRWGLRGAEDLGGGLKAIFQLENGFSTLNGMTLSSGSMFNRMSIVGLSSDRLGTLTLGHMTPFNMDWLGPFSTAYLGENWYMFHPGNIDELANTTVVQMNNAVRYVSPSYNGLSVGAMFAFGNTTNFATGRNYSVGLHYANGPLKAAAVYSNENNRTPNVAGLGVSTFQGVPAARYAADHVENMGAGASYVVGPWLLHALYTRVKLQSLGQSDTYQSYDAGADYATNPANRVTLGAATTSLAGMHWTQFQVGDVYAFSKLTQIYVSGVYQHATGGAVASINTAGASSNGNQLVVMTGVHHSF
ncbi:porin [Pandoraea sp.]|uniref:porin n=1 Tax=Pandoraea sp. TaxID=1883445 RepID=UPI0011F5F5A5|nr:porin [Pandoraea sp.]MBU6492001.1 porin [Burkholderiales bacterium]MDE2288537.1 porin [Burkholderiales bacterium]MDE2611349.1 porin [Burkholderiales bacterium]TAL55100.1 MAG: porin [Pandoraea sp.]TAM19852.1 MAG: porin [Pandoraea sp.]